MAKDNEKMTIGDVIETLDNIYKTAQDEEEGCASSFNIELEVFKNICRHLDNYGDLLDRLESVLEKIDTTLKYSAPYDEMTPEKFEALDRYYLTPLQDHINRAYD